MIRDAVTSDAKSIADIYNYYIKNTIITFETEEINTYELEKRISITLENYDWIIMQNENEEIIGYAYFNSFRPRAAYINSVESTIYLNKNEIGKGQGNILYKELIKRFNQSKYHVMIAGIALPNDPCIKLHNKLGFEKIAELKEIGYKFGKWINVGYWEIIKKNA
jgi:L-amino acid N-acyltransferase YncA